MPQLTPPPWQPVLQNDIITSLPKSPLCTAYSLATLDGNGEPTVRTVVHRGFVNERLPNDKPEWATNSEGVKWDFITVTTDVRSPKALEILSGVTNHGVPSSLSWWFVPTMSQYRISGPVYLLPPPSHPDIKSFPFHDKYPEFSWEEERLRLWRKLPGYLRASFLKSTPGSPLEKGEEETWKATLKDDLEAEGEEKELVKKALENFAVVVIEPKRVDYVDIHSIPNTRTIYTKINNTWESSRVVP